MSRNRTTNSNDPEEDLPEQNLRNNQLLADSGVLITGYRRVRIDSIGQQINAIAPANGHVVAPASEHAVAPAEHHPAPEIDVICPDVEPTAINILPVEHPLLRRESDRIGLEERRFYAIGRWLCSSIAEYDPEYSLPRIFDVFNIHSISEIRVRVRVVVTGDVGSFKAILQIVSLKFDVPIFTHKLQCTSFIMSEYAVAMEEIFHVLTRICYDRVGNKFV